MPPSSSDSSSLSSSRASSPNGFDLQDEHPYNNLTLEGESKLPPGKEPKDVYDTNLSWWRSAIRRKLVANVHWESRVIARMQERIRTSWLDAYFVYTSSLGTHTSFMIVLPTMFFFGLPEMGRGLLMVLALGVYCSSVVKDLICSPRPFAPPVTRLTMGTHHLEYGFPSTHSTNSVSIALFFFSHLHRLASTPASSLGGATTANITSVTNNITAPLFNAPLSISFTTTTANQPPPLISPLLYASLCILLLIYTFSIVFGRLYTAMHSFTDCIVGVLLGTLIWWVQTSWEGFPVIIRESDWGYSVLVWLGIGRVHMPIPTVLSSPPLLINLFKGLSLSTHIESWLTSQTFQVPLILIPLTLWAVHQHPQPVDDCPCFEDAIAFMSVLMGAFVARWGMCYSGGDGDVYGGFAGIARTVVMPGSGWVLLDGAWVQVDREWRDVAVWWLVATVKMVFGILTIFTWRILAKSILHILLPSLFRLLSRAIHLPNRRFYTPATEYKSVPSQFHSSVGSSGEDRGAGAFGLRPIPSVIDLPSSAGVGVEVGGIGSGVAGVSRYLKMRVGSWAGATGNEGIGVNGGGEEVDEKIWHGYGYAMSNDKERMGKDGQASHVKHYDVDVLTKVIVYVGMAVLATEILPLVFELVGWGVTSWV